MRAESTKCLLSAFLGVLNFHAPAVLTHSLVLHLAADEREEGVIASDADAFSWRDLGPALADQNGAGADDLAAVDLDPKHLRVRVAAVARRAAAFLVGPVLRFLLGRATARRLLFFRRLGLFCNDLRLGSRDFLLRRGLRSALRLGLRSFLCL